MAGKENTISSGITSQYWRGDKTWQTLNTSVVTESSNLYYTDSRARASISAGTGINYNSSTGVISAITPISDYTNTALVAGGAGNVVFYLTSDKTATGTALYSNITSVQPIVNDATLNYSFGWTISGDKKTLTVNVKAAVGLNVSLLGLTLLGIPSNVANGTSVNVLVKGN